MSVDRPVVLNTGNNMDKKIKFSHDVRKLTSAAAKLKLSSKKKAAAVADKAEKEKIANNKEAQESVIAEKQAMEQQQQIAPSKKELLLDTRAPKTKSSAEEILAMRRERKWTLTDLLHCLGTYVHHECKGLLSRPTAPEVAMWIRCTDKALHLNGWTINSFLLESHVIFTFMLLQNAFEKFEVRTLTDAKELVLMCLYISYTYNANEISYPLRPFLVKQDRVSFWSKCTELSLDSSSDMLRINRDNIYYSELVHHLRSYSITYTFH